MKSKKLSSVFIDLKGTSLPFKKNFQGLLTKLHLLITPSYMIPWHSISNLLFLITVEVAFKSPPCNESRKTESAMAMLQVLLCYRSMPKSSCHSQCWWRRCSSLKACVCPCFVTQKRLILLSFNELIKEWFQWTYERGRQIRHYYAKYIDFFFLDSFSDLLFIPPQSRHELHSHSFILNYSSFQQSTLKIGIFLANIVVNSLCSVSHKHLEGDVNHTDPRANFLALSPKEKNTLNVVRRWIIYHITRFFFIQHTNTTTFMLSSIPETIITFLNSLPVFHMLSASVVKGVKVQTCLPFLLPYWKHLLNRLSQVCMRVRGTQHSYPLD